MPPELINRKMGISFPRHQQHQQLGSERPQRLPVDQLDLFARLQVSNLRKGECKPTSDRPFLVNKTNRGTYKQREWVSLWQQTNTWNETDFHPPYRLHPLIFHVVIWKTLLWFSLLLCPFMHVVFPKERRQQVNWHVLAKPVTRLVTNGRPYN